MSKLKVEYFTKGCVGNKKCIFNDPKSFGFKDGKAVLKNSEKESNGFFIVKNFNGDSLNNIINAAKSCPVNAIKITDIDSGKDVVSSSVTKAKNFKEIDAKYDDLKEFVIDPAGYFLIRVNRKMGLIEAGFCKSRNIVELKITGKKAIDIYQTVLKEKIITRPDHAAYLGRELAKAEIALENNLDYVQDNSIKVK